MRRKQTILFLDDFKGGVFKTKTCGKAVTSHDFPTESVKNSMSTQGQKKNAKNC